MQSFDEYVSRIEVMDQRIDHHLMEAERKKSLCDRITTVWGEESVQTSKENKRDRRLADLIDSRRQLADLLQEHQEICEEVRSWLYANLPTEGASMLEYKYIDGMNLIEISDMMHIAYQTARNKMPKYVRQAREIYERSIDE